MKFEDVKKLPPEFQAMGMELTLVSSALAAITPKIDRIHAMLESLTKDMMEMEKTLDAEIGSVT